MASADILCLLWPHEGLCGGARNFTGPPAPAPQPKLVDGALRTALRAAPRASTKPHPTASQSACAPEEVPVLHVQISDLPARPQARRLDAAGPSPPRAGRHTKCTVTTTRKRPQPVSTRKCGTAKEGVGPEWGAPRPKPRAVANAAQPRRRRREGAAARSRGALHVAEGRDKALKAAPPPRHRHPATPPVGQAEAARPPRPAHHRLQFLKQAPQMRKAGATPIILLNTRPSSKGPIPHSLEDPGGHAPLRPFPQLTMMAAASSSRRFSSTGKQRLHFWGPERPAGVSARPPTGNGAKARGVRKTRGQQRG